MKVQITKIIDVRPLTLYATFNVRYWEDAFVNGVQEKEDAATIHGANLGRETWSIVVDAPTGKIHNWPEGTTAEVHYKVCDGCCVTLDFDADGERGEWVGENMYVPKLFSPGGDGYGDYVILKVNGDGYIEGWNPNRIQDMIDEHDGN